MAETTSAFNMLDNRIFTDNRSRSAFFHEKTLGFSEASFSVMDPSKLAFIIKKAEAIPVIDWKQFNISADNENYQDAAAPLTDLRKLVTTLLVITVIASAIILSLMLTLWMKSRTHEIGIFLSLGISKSNIIGQHLMEIMMIAVLAFGLSYISGNAIAERIGNMVIEQQQSHSQDIALDMGANPIDAISINADSKMFLLVYLLETIIILLSVSVSSISVMRMEPREILSKMS